METKWWLLFWFLFWSFNPACCSQNETDRLALISFKESILRDPFGVLNSWNDSVHFCDWYINFRNNSLHHHIPQEIGHLRHLRCIILSSNSLQGPIPISLSNASKLEEIASSNNHLTGLIPRDLGKLLHLRVVEFHFNQLEDDLSFIDSLTNCSMLSIIGLRSNFLRGSIPMSIANLSKQMQVMDLAQNELHGTIPMAVENLSNLRHFLLEMNHLTGPILINFDKFQRLEVLSLFQNKIAGTIPSSLGNLSMLSSLYMHFNNLNGSIPPSLGSCKNLIELDLSHNSLTGSIPKQVIGLSSLSVSLSLAGNALSGHIPSEVGLLHNLAKLDLSNNRLSGMIPNSICKCSSLEQLYLQGNSFEGQIPQDLNALQGLQQLDISQNNFSGLIPESLADLNRLYYLNLSFNQLHGEVPEHGVFLSGSAVSLSRNNGLCGGIAEMKIHSCLSPNFNKNNISLAMKVTIPLVAVVVFVVFFLTCWYKKRNMKNIFVPSVDRQYRRISYEQLLESTNGFSKANIIGIGGFGSVYKGTLQQVGMEVAIKVLNMERRGAYKSFIAECQTLGSIRHRNILKLVSICSIESEGKYFKALIYEFMANGSLERWLHTSGREKDRKQRESGNLNLRQRLKIAVDIAHAIDYLHNGSPSTIIHGDLKPSNILLDEEMTAHVGDFGLAVIGSSIPIETQPHGVRGTVGYIAPEYGTSGSVSREGDVYSYGVLLLEMLTGKKPTDESFKDDLDLHTYVKRSFHNRVMNIVDARILAEDCIIPALRKDWIISALEIGVVCSMKHPRDRMEIRDVIKIFPNVNVLTVPV
ncbi:probable LRR receptor-like serine/threonine-protein kinase At3g47570 isoform X2 [Ricinus communis]|uniref:probable LRR receptor-like serine/threonine-protein kinase At3g47570 isoform X2 n=1 Tax=Ricinus communis TaxID=3988 RepID=UPI00077282E3|nr:probable LRR receptor-like serine/threonine-protein kinase At3g47570 isoform X2 [Ricinus communis]|eukprot:XP_015579440.1 probable LRR receptor-like serine/threonine-protein kinase At3g47570 isoform X2 [Ricinus communis]